MYKLLIVDDEPLVQVGIKSMLDWSSLNVEVAGVASNGQTALDFIKENKIDIVITDIKMPVMSGLELAKNCLDLYKDKGPAFIVLTSYEDFNMAREAIKYQVFEYLIKIELTPEVLKDAVCKITAVLDEKNKNEVQPDVQTDSLLNSYHEKFFIRLLHNLFESEEQFALQAQELKINFDYDCFVTSYIEIKSLGINITDNNQLNLFNSAYQMAQSLFDKYGNCYTIPLDLHHFAVIFMSEKNVKDKIIPIIENVSASLKNYYNVVLYSGTGIPVDSPLSISESFQYARDAFVRANPDEMNVSFDELGKEMDYKNSFNFSIFKDSLSRAFEEFDSQLLTKTLGDIIDLFSSHPGRHLQAMDAASNILYMSISLIPDGEAVVLGIFSDSEKGYRNLYTLTTTEQIIGWLKNFSEAMSDYFAEHKKETRKPIVTNIKKYIQDNVKDHLSLNEVAAIFGISPNYLSQLFKKYSDCGFNEYVTNCKINEARRLLTSGDYKVYEVSEMLGFENAFYFSKVFKKVVGVPPTTFMSKD